MLPLQSSIERDLISFDDDPPLDIVPQQPQQPQPRPPSAASAASTATTTASSTTSTTTVSPASPTITTATATATAPLSSLLSPPSPPSPELSDDLAEPNTSSLTPRSYQHKLFELAKDRNIIAVMNTGSGKTLVAVMLIEEILRREAKRLADDPAPAPASALASAPASVPVVDSPPPLQEGLGREEVSPPSLSEEGGNNNNNNNTAKKRLCFFVVNSVPLVFQQANVIRKQCAVARVEEHCGDMRADYLSQQHWFKKLREADVIVLTAQILASVLQHGFLKLMNIALLIFDECHHARNDHPFHNIMRNYYHTAPEESRPKVLGMTASPSSGSAAHLAWCARELELNLDAIIYTANSESVRQYVPQPKEVILCYRRYPIKHLAPEFMRAYGISTADAINGVQTFNIMSSVLSNLGAWCMLRLIQRRTQQDMGLCDADFDQYSMEDDLYAPLSSSSPPSSSSSAAQSASLGLLPPENVPFTSASSVTASGPFTTASSPSPSSLAQPSPSPPQPVNLYRRIPPRFSIEDMTPKVMKLVQLVWASIKKFGKDFCGIIFVERRYTAYALSELLRELEMFKEDLRVGLLVGHGSGGGAGAGGGGGGGSGGNGGNGGGDGNGGDGESGNSQNVDSGSVGAAREGKDRSVSMKYKEQKRILEAFRNNAFNLLVATRVAEEGLDVPSYSHISYIQSRGRARQHQSLFVLMQEQDDRKEEAKLERILNDVRASDEWKKRGGCEDGQGMLQPSDFEQEEPPSSMVGRGNYRYLHTYEVASTNAKLTMESSVSLIYHYCSKLPQGDVPMNRPEFDISVSGTSGFICMLKLPESAPIHKLESDVMSTKTMAKRSAAFKACEQLHRLGALNDNLLPISREKPESKGPAQKKKQPSPEEEATASYPFKPPTFWTPFGVDLLNNTVILHACILRLSDADQEELTRSGADMRPLCMLTAQRLPVDIPPIQLFVNDVERTLVVDRLEPLSSTVQLTMDEIEQLRRFTLVMFSRVGRRWYKCDMAQMTYVLAPLHTNGRFSRTRNLGRSNNISPSHGYGVVQWQRSSGAGLTREDVAWAEVIPLTKEGAVAMLDTAPLTEDEIQGKSSHGPPYDFLVTTKILKNSDFFIKTILPQVGLDDVMDDNGPLGIYVTDYRKQVLKKSKAHAVSTAAAVEAAIKDGSSTEEDLKAKKEEAAAAAAALAELEATTTTEPVTVRDYLRQKHLWTGEIQGPVVVLERTRRFRNHLQTVVQTTDKSEASTSMMCTLGQCVRLPVAASVHRAFAIMPSGLVRLDAYLQAHELQARLGLTEIPVELMLVALTTPSANMAMKYERLELLGDSFLKFSCTIRLYIVNPANDEGALHASRIQIVSNEALRGHAKALELYRHVSATPFHRKAWRPVGYGAEGSTWDEFAAKHFDQELSNKTLADMVEAALGAAFLAGGTELGLKAAKALKIPFPEFEDWGAFARVHELPALQPPLVERNRINILQAQRTLGYTFKNPMLFLEAMTHASSLQSTSACYQRLEFLGDAVLDFLVVQRYYELHPEADPGTIVMAKDNSVSNRILGALAMELGLYRYLDQSSSGLMATVANAVVIVEEFKANQALKREKRGGPEQQSLMSVGDRGRLADQYSKMMLTPQEQGEEFSFWLNISVPKVLGDLVESTIGAVFVDSGFDYQVVCDLFDRLIWPFIERHVTFEDVAMHPTKELLETLQAYGCNEFEYETKDTGKSVATLLPESQLFNSAAAFSGATTVIEVSFIMHGRPLAKVQSPHAEQCKKETSVAVLQLLKKQPGLLGQVCTCPKRKKGAKATSA
ncbi:Dicer-like protein 1 [Actinomortierella ambigua]|nr:Dicer-like protein 1 [Actinomortierella ambigua]